MFSQFTSLLSDAQAKMKTLVESTDMPPAVETLNSKIKETLTLEEGYNVEEQQDGVKSSAAVGIWARPSDRWAQKNKCREWEEFVAAVIDDENTFCIPVSRTLTLETATLLANSHGVMVPPQYFTPATAAQQDEGVDDLKKQKEAEQEQDDADAALLIARYPQINDVRYRCVPRFTNESTFWKNLFDKLRIVSLSTDGTSINQILALLMVLNAEPTRDQENFARKKNMGNPQNEAQIQAIAERVKQCANQQLLVDNLVAKVETAIEQSTHSVQLLTSLIGGKKGGGKDSGSDRGGAASPGMRDGDGAENNNEFTDSVVESCKFHKSKVSELIGKVLSADVSLQGTRLDSSCGELFRELQDANATLHDIIEQYYSSRPGGATTATSSSPSVALPTRGGSPSGAAGSKQTSAVVSAAPSNRSSAPPTTINSQSDVAQLHNTVSANRGDGQHANDGTEFSAQLPWDDEE